MNGSTLKSRLASVALAAVVAACGGGSGQPAATATPTGTTTASPSAPPTDPASSASTAGPTSAKIALRVYFLLIGNIDGPTPLVPVYREVDRTVAIAQAAMEQLLAGPTIDERAHDLSVGTIGTQIPEGTRVLGLDVADGIATVDLSGEFTSGDIDGDERESWAIRLAQVTYTLTQFPTVDSVRFMVDGKAARAIEGHEGTPIDLATRGAYADQRPGIFIDQPAWGGELTDPLFVSGMAQILAEPAQFEAALAVRTTGEILVQQSVESACAPGCWQPPGGGPFEFQMSVPDSADPDDLMLIVWAASSDGGQSITLAYPLH